MQLKNMIDRIAANGWKIPAGVSPREIISIGRLRRDRELCYDLLEVLEHIDPLI